MSDISPKPTQGLKRKPRCFGHKVHENQCIRCVWLERCMHFAYYADISFFKENFPENHEAMVEKITESTSFED